LKENNNSFKTSNIFDSKNNNIMNLVKSANLFNINISIIKNNNDKSNIENLNEKDVFKFLFILYMPNIVFIIF